MTPDSGFPVCYGEKGILEGQMVTEGAVSVQVLEVRFTTGSKGPFSQPFPVGTTSRWFQNPIRLSQCFSSPPMP